MLSLRKLLVQSTFLLYSLVVLFPMVWLFYTSFKSTDELFASAWSLPTTWAMTNFVKAWNEARLGDYFWNSIFVTSTTLVVQLLVGYIAVIPWQSISSAADPCCDKPY